MEISRSIIKKCYEHGIKTYPEEACGLISGPAYGDRLETVHQMQNLMSKCHELNPKQFLRTNLNGFMIDPKEQIELEERLQQESHRTKIIYHSHPNKGAYFSETDKAIVLLDGEPVYSGIHYLVCGIKDGKPNGAILAVFNPKTKDFDIECVE